jgi:hypothetical protein
MVAVSAPVVGATPTAGAVATLLDDAVLCLDRHDHVGAGVRIRHAAKLLLTALAQSCGISRPLRHVFPRAARIARALYKARRLDQATFQALLATIDACNAAAHCGDVCETTLRDGVELLRTLIDGGPRR